MMYFYAVAGLLLTSFSVCSGFALNEWSKQHGDRSWHRRYRSPYVLGLCLLILSAPLVLYLPKEKDPIAVSPSEVKLTDLFNPDKRFRGKIDLLVYNRTDDPYHQIWVKIVVESDFLSPDLIDLDFSQNAELGPPSCLKGTDKHSKKAFLCFIGSLAPKKELNIKLTSNFDPGNISNEQLGKAFIVVSKFETYPHQSYENFPGGEKAASWKAGFPDTEAGFKSKIVK